MKQVKELTAQQIFDKVAKHLAKQGKKALEEFKICRNFTGSELRCAVGCLIPRSFYRKPENRDFWKGSAYSLRDVLKTYGIDYTTHENLLLSLQMTHDDFQVEDWPLRLKQVAIRFGLKVPAWLEAVA